MGNVFRFFTSNRTDLDDHDMRQYEEKKLYKDLTTNLDFIKEKLGNGTDLVVREFVIDDNNTKAGLCFIDGLVNKDFLQNYIMSNLMIFTRIVETSDEEKKKDLIDELANNDVTASELANVDNYKDVFNKILSGDSILLIDKQTKAFGIGSRGWSDRGVSYPSTEPANRGPKDAFTETLRTNTVLLRRRIKNINLRIESMTIGTITNTDIVISYVEGLVKPEVLQELRKRLKKIDVDSIVESSHIQKAIQNRKFTMFSTVGESERPDVITAKLLEGRIAIIVDGSPFVLFAPIIFSDLFKSSEEYYQKYSTSLLIRGLRYFSFFSTIYIPAFYLAYMTFNQELVPTMLLVSFLTQYTGITTPVIIELLVMLLIFELLRETSYRLPIYSSASILFVSGLIISSNVVEAGLVSSIMIIIVGVTVVTNFIFRSVATANTVRLLRLLLILFTSMFGLLGIIMGTIAIVLHINSLASLNVKYVYMKYPYNHSESKVKNPIKKLYGYAKERITNFIKNESMKKGGVKNETT